MDERLDVNEVKKNIFACSMSKGDSKSPVVVKSDVDGIGGAHGVPTAISDETVRKYIFAWSMTKSDYMH